MDKLHLTGQTLGWVFNSISDWMFVMHLFCHEAKQPNLKLETQPRQLLGSLSLAFVLPSKLLFCQLKRASIIGPTDFRSIVFWPNDVASEKIVTCLTNSLSIHRKVLEKMKSWQILFLFAKQTNPNQSNRRSTVQWYFPL